MKAERLRGSERKTKDDKHSNSIFNVTEIAPLHAAPGEFLNFSFNKRKQRGRRACLRDFRNLFHLLSKSLDCSFKKERVQRFHAPLTKRNSC